MDGISQISDIHWCHQAILCCSATLRYLTYTGAIKLSYAVVQHWTYITDTSIAQLQSYAMVQYWAAHWALFFQPSWILETLASTHQNRKTTDQWSARVWDYEIRCMLHSLSVSLYTCWSWAGWQPPCARSQCHGRAGRWTATCTHTFSSGSHLVSCLL